MSEYYGTFYNLWILTHILKVKSKYFIKNLLNGNTRSVLRIEESLDKQTVISNIYNHLSNLLDEPAYIIDNIYLGSAYNVSNLETLNKYGIERILNVTKEIPCSYPDLFTYKSIAVKDTRDSFLANYMEEAYQFIIDSPLKQVIVHCYMGSSRSATIVIYYLMKQHNMTYQEALDYVKSKRHFVNLNINFAKELKTLNTET